MLFKYIQSAFRKNKGYYILQTVAAALITIALVFVFCRSALLNGAAEAYQRQLSGDADVRVTAEGSPDRFFSLSNIKNDPVIGPLSAEVRGYFKTCVAVGTGDAAVFCTAFVAPYGELRRWNPFSFEKGETPPELTDSGVVASRSFAEARGARTGAVLRLSFGELDAEYTVAAVAEDRGLFANVQGSFNSLFLSAEGFRRIFSKNYFANYNADIVTDAFIRLNGAEGADAVLARIGEISDLSARRVAAGMDDVSGLASAPLGLVAVCAAVFCFCAFTFLLYLLFLNEKPSLSAIRAVGMTGRSAFGIECAIGGLVFAGGFFLGAFLSAAAAFALRNTHFLLADFRIGVSVYGRAGLSAAVSAGAAVLIAHAAAYPERLGRFFRFVFRGSGFALFAAPYALYGLAKLFRAGRGLRGALLKNNLRGGVWRGAAFLLLAGTCAFLLSFSALNGLNARARAVAADVKFDAVIANLGAEPDRYYDSVAAFGEAGAVYRARAYFDGLVVWGGRTASALVLAGERDFIADFTGFTGEEAARFSSQKDACIVSAAQSARYGLRPGDAVTAVLNGEEREFRVFAVLNDDFYFGFYFLINLEPGAPYTHLIVDTAEGAETGAFRTRNLIVIDFRDALANYGGYFADFLRAAYMFTGFLTAFTAVVLSAVLAALRKRTDGEFRRFYSVGLSRARYKAALFLNFLCVLLFNAAAAALLTALVSLLLIPFAAAFGLALAVPLNARGLLSLSVAAFLYFAGAHFLVHCPSMAFGRRRFRPRRGGAVSNRRERE
ncbi:MAG: hypothetical protein LBL66_04515 [Clostridiales bacterium]|nr:hypothetical protein [Clostridiales bacterium]